MKITQLSVIPKPKGKLLYQHLKPNDTFLMHGDEDVRIRTEDGHIGFHKQRFYEGGLKIAIYRDELLHANNVVRLITVDLQWCEKESS